MLRFYYYIYNLISFCLNIKRWLKNTTESIYHNEMGIPSYFKHVVQKHKIF